MEYTEAALIGTKAFHWFMVFLPTTGLNYQCRGGGGDGGRRGLIEKLRKSQIPRKSLAPARQSLVQKKEEKEKRKRGEKLRTVRKE